MGRPGAYLEVPRSEHGVRDALEATGDYQDIAVCLSEEEQRLQASRCMYCGVAFCQAGLAFGGTRTSGCPLHNLIPEWNDLMYRGLWREAYERLTLTNPFPEFTGRVCPAPCEVSCNLGLNDEATTIRDNERAISDHAWSSGNAQATFGAAGEDAPSVAVIGSGPAGMACAWELRRQGACVDLVERDDRAGGLLMYGIPNMKLSKDVVERRFELMRSCGISVACGQNVADPEVAEALLAAHDTIVVATGAHRARPLTVPGMDLAGVTYALDYLGGATKALLDGTAPEISACGLDVVVVGGGDTGCDCVACAVRQGAKSVTQLEFLARSPKKRTVDNPWPEWPHRQGDGYGHLEARAVYGRDPRQWGTETLAIEGADGKVSGLTVASVDWSSGHPVRIGGTERVLPAQLVIIATGFAGPEPDVFANLGVTCADDAGGLPQTVAHTHRAAGDLRVPVFVAGDCRSGASLVVQAIADGLACANEVMAYLKD